MGTAMEVKETIFDEAKSQEISDFIKKYSGVSITPISSKVTEDYISLKFVYKGVEIESLSFKKDVKALYSFIISELKLKKYDKFMEIGGKN